MSGSPARRWSGASVGVAGSASRRLGLEVVVHRADIILDGMNLLHVEALATKRPYVVLGRNVLEHVVLRMDGPQETIEIRRPRKRWRGAADTRDARRHALRGALC